ncbi:hypothetical protein FHX52_1055 [Humibacillus xanthopallidus]|uniref:DUF5343 domain-containing protein n=1 Tax=Humibacillus xanthopallidus TaxID=412689 RepID=A0A543PV60_9MICO|nr:DUF5343 domain-containing protein [Humibacillus xanthopallidus]TQN47936.1 hypothetical protein FHX52_1055 [Humibacillus xanthopallidus]
MLTSRYLPSTKNVDALFDKIIGGVAPDKMTVEHLKALGFSSSNDRAFIPLLKDLGFLTPDGTPTPRYHAYRDRSKSKVVMAEALRDAYSDVFHLNEKPTTADRPAVQGLFKSKLNSSDRLAQVQAMTFYALLARADLSATAASGTALPEEIKRNEPAAIEDADTAQDVNGLPFNERPGVSAQLHYTIQVHLPATKDLEVYNAIFRSLRENLLA